MKTAIIFLVLIWAVIMAGVIFINPLTVLVGIAVFLLTMSYCIIER